LGTIAKGRRDAARGMKTCSKCGKDKPRSMEFFRPDGRGYFRSLCKVCDNKLVKERYRKNPEPSKRRAKVNGLMNRYGLTVEDYEEMYRSQDGRCASCRDPLPLGGKTGLHVDHDHRTKKVRALLCPKCNTILGLACESVQRLVAVVCYIQKHTAAVGEENIEAVAKS
jgi:hypothetical protein